MAYKGLANNMSDVQNEEQTTAVTESLVDENSYEALAIRPEYVPTIRSNMERRAQVTMTRPSEFSDLRMTAKGTVVIPIKGSIAKTDSFFSRFFGETSNERIQALVKQASRLDGAKRAVIAIDSPGGVVSGSGASAQAIVDLRQKMPVHVFVDGQMASAAYLIGSGAQTIAGTASSEFGSISVVLMHVDFSKAESAQGITVTELTSGKFKRIASPHKPLSEEGREYLQALIDDHHAVMVGTIQSNRGLSDAELKAVAQGQLFIGQKAVDAGIADRIVGSLDEFIESLEANESEQTTVGGTRMANETQELTAQAVKEQYPAVAEALVSEAVASAKAEATAAERTRIQGIFDIAPEGMDEEAKQMAFVEPATQAEAAVAFLKGVKEKGAQLYKAHVEDAPAPVTPSADTDETSSDANDPVLAAIEAAAVEENERLGYGSDVPAASISARMPKHADRVVKRGQKVQS